MDPGNLTLLAATTPSGEVSGTIGGLIFFMVIAVFVSFLCSLLEASMLSTPPTYTETQAERGTRAGKLMRKLKNDIDEPITAILTLNTFAHTVGATGAGAQAVAVFGTQFAAVITVILTLLILILSEIIPKTIGAVYWKQLFTFTAHVVNFLVIILYPAVWTFKLLTQILTSREKLPTVTRSELEMMAQISTTEGALDEEQARILNNLFKLDGVQVSDIMTPRTVVVAFQQDLTVGEVIGSKRLIPYSRIPIYRENMDDITGFVLRHDILKAAAADQDNVPLSEFVRQLYSVPETITVAKVLNEFTKRQEHIFLVFDEYGGTAGIITMEDAIESLLGTEITDESDIVADMRQLAHQRYLRQKSLLEVTALSLNGTNDTAAGTQKHAEDVTSPQTVDTEETE